MTDIALTAEPLSNEYRDAYYKVVHRIVTYAEKYEFGRRALGRTLFDIVSGQLARLNAIASGAGEEFDTRREARILHRELYHNFKTIYEGNEAASAYVTEVSGRLSGFLEKDHYPRWANEQGRAVLARLGQLMPDANLRGTRLGLDAQALKLAFFAADEALALSTPAGFRFSLSALSEAFTVYYFDAMTWRRRMIPVLKAQAEVAFGFFAEVDGRIEQKRLADLQLAERERVEREARAAESDDDFSLAGSSYSGHAMQEVAGSAGEPESHTFGANADSESSPCMDLASDVEDLGYSWDTSSDISYDDYGVNPANGLPMIDHVFDCHLNVFGTDNGY